MATKQQVREQITKVIQEGILKNVLPYQSINGEFDCSIFDGTENSDICDGEFGNFCRSLVEEGSPCDNQFDVPCYQLSDAQINLALQYGSSCIEDTITAQSYQSIVGDDGQIQVQKNTTGEQVVIYQEDFQTAENQFNTFVNDVAECYKNSDGTYEEFGITDLGMADGSGLEFSLEQNVIGELTDVDPYITTNITVTNGFGVDCPAGDLPLMSALIILTQFQSLSNTSTQINPTQAQEILDTTIFELLTQQTSRQQRIDKFFQDYSELKPEQYLTEYLDTNPGSTEQDFNLTYDIYNNPIDGSIIRLINNEDDDNVDKSLEWLRQDLNNYFSDDSSVEEDLQIYQERSSGYLKFREMNQSIIIRNTENLPVINDSETFLGTNQKGFTITMWVKFKDKISSGTLFNYGNPLRETNPYGFMLETYVLNANDNNRDGGSNITSGDDYTNWKELANHLGLDYFNNNDEARFLRLVVNSDINVSGGGTGGEKLYDSHMVINNDGADGVLEKQNNSLSNTSSGQSRRFIATTNVPIDFNEWYFITATFNPTNNETIDEENKLKPLYWSGNLLDASDNTSTTYDSGLGNKCKVEIISKTDLLRARGYTTQ